MYSIKVPYRVGQKVYQAVTKIGLPPNINYITPEWQVEGYKLSETDELYAMCVRTQGEIKRHEYLLVSSLFPTKEAAIEHLKG